MQNQSMEKVITYSTNIDLLKQIQKELEERIKKQSEKIKEMSDSEYFSYSYSLFLEKEVKQKTSKYGKLH